MAISRQENFLAKLAVINTFLIARLDFTKDHELIVTDPVSVGYICTFLYNLSWYAQFLSLMLILIAFFIAFREETNCNVDLILPTSISIIGLLIYLLFLFVWKVIRCYSLNNNECIASNYTSLACLKGRSTVYFALNIIPLSFTFIAIVWYAYKSLHECEKKKRTEKQKKAPVVRISRHQ